MNTNVTQPKAEKKVVQQAASCCSDKTNPPADAANHDCCKTEAEAKPKTGAKSSCCCGE